MTGTTIDVLSQALNLMRVTGSLLLAESYASPWGIAIPDQAALARLMAAGAGVQVVAFHVVHRGGFTLGTAAGAQQVQAGEMVVCFGGLPHTLSQGSPANLVPLEAHLNGARNRFRPLWIKDNNTR